MLKVTYFARKSRMLPESALHGTYAGYRKHKNWAWEFSETVNAILKFIEVIIGKRSDNEIYTISETYKKQMNLF